MISLKSKQKGFTIVELLIVIVVIGILAGLIIVTFSGIQKKARDTERKTDIAALNSHLEAFHASNGHYPTLANLNLDSWVDDNLKGLDIEALQDPNGADNDLVDGAGDADTYGYDVAPATCDNDEAGDCTSYTLTATLEDGGTFVKTSVND